MKNRTLIIALAITFLAVVSPLPRADGDPLTILAILGLATVASISTVDIVAGNEPDTRDFRAQQNDVETPNAQVEPADSPPPADKIEVAAR
jgi:hypothetical protein